MEAALRYETYLHFIQPEPPAASEGTASLARPNRLRLRSVSLVGKWGDGDGP
jgi:hypothetical protein